MICIITSCLIKKAGNSNYLGVMRRCENKDFTIKILKVMSRSFNLHTDTHNT